MADWRLPFSHVDNNSRIRRARSRSPQRERIWPSVQRGYDREYPSTSWSSGESWDYNQWRQPDPHYYHDEIYHPARESYYPEESEPFSYDRRGWYPQHSRFSEYSPGFFQNDDVPRQARRLPNDISRQLRRPQDETVRGRLPDDIPRPIRQLPGGITWRQNSDGISQHVKRPPDYITQQVKLHPLTTFHNRLNDPLTTFHNRLNDPLTTFHNRLNDPLTTFHNRLNDQLVTFHTRLNEFLTTFLLPAWHLLL